MGTEQKNETDGFNWRTSFSSTEKHIINQSMYIFPLKPKVLFILLNNRNPGNKNWENKQNYQNYKEMCLTYYNKNNRAAALHCAYQTFKRNLSGTHFIRLPLGQRLYSY